MITNPNQQVVAGVGVSSQYLHQTAVQIRDALTPPAGFAAAFEPFITKPEVARRLGKRMRTIDNWMQRGLLPYYKIGRSVSFKWSEVEQHLRHLCRVCRAEEE